MTDEVGGDDTDDDMEQQNCEEDLCGIYVKISVCLLMMEIFL